MPAPRAACSARRSPTWLRETSPKATPSFTRTSHQSMPSLRPFSHSPPSESGDSFFLNSVLYERTGGFFGNSIAGPPLSERMRGFLLGRRLLVLPDDLGRLREPRLIPARLHPGEDDDAQSQPDHHHKRRPPVQPRRERAERGFHRPDQNEARSHREDEVQEPV